MTAPDDGPVTDFLDLDDLIAAATAAVGGQPQVRDWGLLGSALARPQAHAFGEPAYPTLHLQAAALLDSLARNHGLVDGNKRLAWVAARLFYIYNGHDMRAPGVDEGEAFVLAVSVGKLEVTEIASTLAEWATPAPPLSTWHEPAPGSFGRQRAAGPAPPHDD